VVAVAAAVGVIAPLAVCALRAYPQPAQPQQSAPATSVVETPEQAIQRELVQQAEILNSPEAKAEQRDQAAERLVQRHRPDATNILLNTLRDSGNRAAQIAVARALSHASPPDPRFVEPLHSLLESVALQDRDPRGTETVVDALTKYRDDPEVLKGLIEFARAPTMVPRVRMALIHGIGSFVKKQAAEHLIEVINNMDADSSVRNEAMDALGDMTGLKQVGHDLGQWNAWWNNSRNQTDEQWEGAQYRRRSELYGQAQQENRRLIEIIKRSMQEDYQRTTATEQRTALVLGWLKSSEPAFRAEAASIIKDQFLEGGRPAAEVMQQLRRMIGDSSVEVRSSVLLALREMTDTAAIDAVLAQLAVETDPDVKVTIAWTLARLKDLRAVGPLLALLNDPVPRVVEAAAEALRDLGDQIQADAALTRRASAALRGKLQAVNDQPGADDLRAALIEALAPLRDDGMLATARDALLNPNDPRNSPKVRIAACKVLGNIVDPRNKQEAAGVLVPAMRDDNEAGVRLAAARALGSVGSAPEANALFDRMREDPDRSVRDVAWDSLAKVLARSEIPAATLANSWADRFRVDPAAARANPARYKPELEKRLAVQQIAREKLVRGAGGPAETKELASLDQNIGDTQALLQQWDKAAESYRLALDYWLTHNGPPNAVHQLSQQRIISLLRSGNYDDSIKFVRDRIAADAEEQRVLGNELLSELQRLSDVKETAKARELLDAIDKMQPPLEGPYAERIKRLGDEIRQRSATPNPVTPPSLAGEK
jgi:HEAT repeat protein